jgi:cytochrome P450
MYNDVSFEAMAKLQEYATSVLTERQSKPRDDMFTDLLNGEIVDDEGELRRFTMKQAVNFALLIANAGTETVARLLGWAAPALDHNPDQRAELAADPRLIPNAVEELLRYEAPSPVQSRWCTADHEIHGQTIPANSKVVMVTGSAGRDSASGKARPHLFIRARCGVTRSCRSPSDQDLRPLRGSGRRQLHWPTHPALVAQRTRASDYGSEGWGFESLRARAA